MKSLQPVLLAAALSLGSTLTLACEPPAEPPLPDPATAVTPQMVKAMNDVKAYLSDAEAYLACARSGRRKDAMITRMNELADEFNAIVRSYKARMAS